MYKEILNNITNTPFILFIIIILITIIMTLKKENEKNNKKVEKKEKFEINQKPAIRYMYNTSGIKRNSSYDSRGEQSFIKYEPEKTGKTYHGDLSNNFTNDRIMKN